jgi:hypothetical protein
MRRARIQIAAELVGEAAIYLNRGGIKIVGSAESKPRAGRVIFAVEGEPLPADCETAEWTAFRDLRQVVAIVTPTDVDPVKFQLVP